MENDRGPHGAGDPAASTGKIAVLLIAALVLGGPLAFFGWQALGGLLAGEIDPRSLVITGALALGFVGVARIFGGALRGLLAVPEGSSGDTLPPPIGTLFVLTLYIAVLIGMWGTIYAIMLERAS